MGIQEVWLLVVTQQLTNAAQVFCTKAGSLVTNKTGILAYNIGAQLAGNFNKLATWGLKAANAEFATKQAQEATFASSVNTLPPIT